MIRGCLIIISLCFLFGNTAKAQIKDSVNSSADSTKLAKATKKKIYSGPRKASILSAVLPGLGQAYNRKFWKIPIVYAGLGGFGYMFYFNNSQYNDFRKEVRAAYDNDPSTLYDTRYSPDQLQILKLYYRKYRDIAIIGMSVVYLVNIIDANVDAHLKTFDVSDDLSINVEPWYQIINKGNSFGTATGLTLKFNF
jgi:hypothetical protein